MATTPEDEFLRSHRLELPLAYLQRADQSADRIRAMTLAIATAAFGFIIHEYKGDLARIIHERRDFGLASMA